MKQLILASLAVSAFADEKKDLKVQITGDWVDIPKAKSGSIEQIGGAISEAYLKYTEGKDEIE